MLPRLTSLRLELVSDFGTASLPHLRGNAEGLTWGVFVKSGIWSSFSLKAKGSGFVSAGLLQLLGSCDFFGVPAFLISLGKYSGLSFKSCILLRPVCYFLRPGDLASFLMKENVEARPIGFLVGEMEILVLFFFLEDAFLEPA